jgi:sugar-specific transcriptional regulator TrmB
MQTIDLTPFGFTPTESLAYSGLLDNGPSSGYALARSLSIARANAYQALRGLVAKEAAVVAERDPEVFRAVQPAALLARISRDQEGKLVLLEQQVTSSRMAGAPATTAFTGERELFALALRSITREASTVSCIAPLKILSSLLPIWRKREADGAESRLWVSGDLRGAFAVPIVGSLPEDRIARYFGSPAALIVAENCASVAMMQDDVLTGLWSSDPIIRGAVQASVAAITGPA